MKIWVDADACPAAIKEILFRAARRTGIELTLVANQMLRTPPSPSIRAVQVPSGADVADRWIIAACAAGDLVITADIPLAAEVIARGARVIDPRGEQIDAGTIGERLAMRNFLDQLRGSGVDTGGPAAFSAADAKAFGARLDALLSRELAARRQR
ncbi:YaiI/YqxD family protein [Pseudothauera lacus]|uniref:UPF0178 protein C8261_08915 n=1 Tax=Pseudothauera lacus TaxID=2136175 RepID=A0A2T4IF76_9RHOO|nr:YaiI/YqxD family protein [Pseudothauera lacus]PTD96425.1 YaiI/YqxD family protein [Pseudothauera lacus]